MARKRRQRTLAAIASKQVALLTLEQARRAGFTDDEIDGRVVRGELERIARTVLAIAGVPWTWERRAVAAGLAVGPGARLSHRAAAHALGFDGFGECPIELTVTRGRRARTPLAVVHTTAAVHNLDVVSHGRFRVTSAARTIIDLCAVGATDAQLSAAIGSALRDGFTSERFLRKRLGELRGPGRRGVRTLDAVLLGPFGHSPLERAFLRIVAAAGLPPPTTQVTYRGERVMRVDALWLDARLVVEVMGHRFHATRTDLQRDAQRRNELQGMGLVVLEVTTDDLATRPAHVTGRIARHLARAHACSRDGNRSSGRGTVT